MKISANGIRIGMIIEHEGKQWLILKTQVVQPGKGGAFMTVDMRDVASGNKSVGRWRTADTVERLEVRDIECTYLFKEGEMYTFMDKENYEQFALSSDLIGEKAGFLQDNMEVSVNFIEGKAISINLPTNVVLLVTEADPVVKGQTAASSYKPGLLENGMKVLIPPFIEAGTRIVVATEDCSYVERAK
jgi:elongation factor P